MGSKDAIILEPSKGGKGSKLNTPSMILYHKVINKILKSIELVIIFKDKRNPIIIAIIKFDNGPAKDTKIVSLFLF